MMYPILRVEILHEHDVVLARQRARQIAQLLGFLEQDQTRIATAVSEVARNAYVYAGGGRVDFGVAEGTGEAVLQIRVADQGPGIPDLDLVLSGRYRSKHGMGLGLIGARRLMDQFEIESNPGRGTVVVLGKIVPGRKTRVQGRELAGVAERLALQPPESPLEEVQHQNQELIRALNELRERQEELGRLNEELLDTNRGVVALYAEMEEQASNLKRADELKTRFLSNMSHEFRTPLNSILALSRILLEHTDAELNDEQDRQVSYIRKAAEDLSELVNDLLDLARVEAGKITVQPADFDVSDLFSTLRGMLRPLLTSENVSLVFEEPEDLPPLRTDEGKVSQILRNFISNALKFTERGEVRIGAQLHEGRQAVVFSIADTGIGIREEDLQRIFHEFTQLDSHLQRRFKGTGLGLPLSKKLAELLGGAVWVKSSPGLGSTFYVAIPLVYEGPVEVYTVPPIPRQEDPTRHPVLVVEDNAATIFEYQKLVKGTGFQVIPAPSTAEARALLNRMRPVAVLLDILLPDGEGWSVLRELKSDEHTKDLPVFVVTLVEDRERALALGAHDYTAKPLQREWLLERLRARAQAEGPAHVLIIDEEPAARYLFRGFLVDTKYEVVEAAGGEEGVRLARELRPEVIFLDLFTRGVSGFDVLAALRADPQTSSIPVIVTTSVPLDEQELAKLSKDAEGVLHKGSTTREAAVNQIRHALQFPPVSGATTVEELQR